MKKQLLFSRAITIYVTGCGSNSSQAKGCGYHVTTYLRLKPEATEARFENFVDEFFIFTDLFYNSVETGHAPSLLSNSAKLIFQPEI